MVGVAPVGGHLDLPVASHAALPVSSAERHLARLQARHRVGSELVERAHHALGRVVDLDRARRAALVLHRDAHLLDQSRRLRVEHHRRAQALAVVANGGGAHRVRRHLRVGAGRHAMAVVASSALAALVVRRNLVATDGQNLAVGTICGAILSEEGNSLPHITRFRITVEHIGRVSRLLVRGRVRRHIRRVPPLSRARRTDAPRTADVVVRQPARLHVFVTVSVLEEIRRLVTDDRVHFG